MKNISFSKVADEDKVSHVDLNFDKSILFDQYSRYKVCADILKKMCSDDGTVLDVGSGEGCLLGKFLPDLKITYADPLLSLYPERSPDRIAGDIFSKELDGRVFDFVVSIDTLEHVSPEQRSSFIERVSSLANKGIVLACPCSDVGDALNTDRRLNDAYSLVFGKNYSWLDEHFKYGLPRLFEILKKLNALGWQTQVVQNGHTPWLCELLGFTLCALESPGLKPVVFDLSEYFINNLYEFDHFEPCYRQVIAASRNGSLVIPYRVTIDDKMRSRAAKQWSHIQKRLMRLSASGIYSSQQRTAIRESGVKSQTLEATYSSNFRKAANLYYRLRDNMPVFRYTYKSLKIIKDEGFVVFLRKVHRKVREGIRKSVRSLKNSLPGETDFSLTGYSNKYDIIFFSIIDWDFRHQRPQHIASRLAGNGHRVFYLSTEFKKQKSYKATLVRDNIYEISLPSVANNSIYNVNIQEGFEKQTSAIKAMIDDFRIKESIAIVEFPLWHPLVKHLKNEYNTKIVFDCLDEFSGFRNVRADIAQEEELLLNLSDFCITTSAKLYEKHKDKCRNIAMVRNGTEFKHFNNLPHNNLLKKIKKPIIGYYGAIAEWFDTETVEYIAAKNPDWNIVLIGHTFGSGIERLKRFSNIHFLGEKPYSELPKYLYWFDVCMIPFKINELTLSTNPVKFYEFISSGRPVVSSMLPELLPYNDLLYLSENKDKFLRNIEMALKENSGDLIKKRVELARENDWDMRVDNISSCIKSIYPLTSIVIVTYNNIEYTKLCIESIYAKTAYPNFEVIIVDNASSDGTAEHLNSLREYHDNIRVILNDKNLGFAAANNIGIKESRGEYIILLNNDAVVTRGWISGLIKHLKDPAIGIVGPVTNSIGNEAKINISYKDLSEMEVFADNYTSRNRGIAFEISVLALYCAAIRKKVVDKIGLLDEQFSVGMFEDDDYAVRVKKAGFKIICAEDVFIHHFGGASFSRLQAAEYRKIFEENKNKFERKWGISWQPHKYRNGVL